MSNNLKIRKISDLPDSSNVESTYFFGYDNRSTLPLDQRSVKIPFADVAKASNERRIAIVMERDSQLIPIGEKMKITKTICKNVKELTIKPSDSSTAATSIDINTNVNIDLSSYVTKGVDAIIEIKGEQLGTDPNPVTSTVYLFTKILE